MYKLCDMYVDISNYMPCPCSHVDGSMWIYFDVIFDVLRRTFLRALFAVVVVDPGEYYYIIL